MANLFMLITLALITMVSILIFMTFVKAELGSIERLLNERKYIDRTGVDYTGENVFDGLYFSNLILLCSLSFS